MTCAIIDDEPLAVKLLETYVQKTPGLTLNGSYSSAVKAIGGLAQQPVDILFLDIQMPDVDGMSFARMIQNGNMQIIFTTASPMPIMHDEYNPADVEGMEFACKLLLDTLHNREEGEALIKSHLKGWEFERVAQMDVLLITMALSELMGCPSIPERVTVDEYIELSKEFSTDRSKLFINGILDKLIVELRSSGRIQKSGRGLYDPDIVDHTED